MTSVTSTCGSSPEDVGTGRKPRLSAQIDQAEAEERLEQRLGDERRRERRVARVRDAAVQQPELDDVAAARRDDAVEARARQVGGHRVARLAGPWRPDRRRAGSCASRAAGRPGPRCRGRIPRAASHGFTLAARWSRSSSAWSAVRKTSLSIVVLSVLTTHGTAQSRARRSGCRRVRIPAAAARRRASGRGGRSRRAPRPPRRGRVAADAHPVQPVQQRDRQARRPRGRRRPRSRSRRRRGR